MLGSFEDPPRWSVPRTLSDILRRFRPAVAPGPAAAAGVPADRLAESLAELAPVFAALEAAVSEAGRVRADGRAEAEARRRWADREANRILAEARARVDAVRAAAAAVEVASLDAERMALQQQALVEVDRVRRQAEAHLPGLVDGVLERVWGSAGLAPGGARARREVRA
jgi:hypothetical protein